MKFTNATIFRLVNESADSNMIEDALAAHHFIECGPTQASSMGWMPPRDESGAMLEVVAGQSIAKLMIETRSVPAAAVKRKIDERIAQIEDATGRKPGKKERKDLKEEVMLELLPLAFPKRVSIGVWYDAAAGLLVVDTASATRADAVVTALVKAVPGISVGYLNTVTTPAAAMSCWLETQDAPVGITIDRECELRATDESKAVVRYANHALDIDEVVEHIQAGMVPSYVAMTLDGRVSFRLTEGGQLRKLQYLDVDMENGEKSDEFDTDVAIFTGELQVLIRCMIGMLGGELVASQATAEAA